MVDKVKTIMEKQSTATNGNDVNESREKSKRKKEKKMKKKEKKEKKEKEKKKRKKSIEEKHFEKDTTTRTTTTENVLTDYFGTKKRKVSDDEVDNDNNKHDKKSKKKKHKKNKDEKIVVDNNNKKSRKRGKKSDDDNNNGTKKNEDDDEQRRKSIASSSDSDNPSVPVVVAPVEQEDNDNNNNNNNTSLLPFDHKYVLAPMVGASELPFRLLCRKYGTTLAYTPMMIAEKFVNDARYREEEFQTLPGSLDRPLVCHFGANDPTVFANAVQLVHEDCDAIDLNLGCPQRTAFIGHFGSYLLDRKDRELLCSIVRSGVEAAAAAASKKNKNKNNNQIQKPIFVKIRLLDTVPETIELCQQLISAGASLIAIHGRYRATWDRKGPGARDGPAHLDQIQQIRQAIRSSGRNTPIITNGNTITYEDVVNNLQFTKANGIMSAEGLLDNPALYLPRFGSRDDPKDCSKLISVTDPLSLLPPSSKSSLLSSAAASSALPLEKQQQQTQQQDQQQHANPNNNNNHDNDTNNKKNKEKRKLLKKLREIDRIVDKIKKDGSTREEDIDRIVSSSSSISSLSCINEDEKKKLSSRKSIQRSLKKLLDGEKEKPETCQAHEQETTSDTTATGANTAAAAAPPHPPPATTTGRVQVTLGSLYDVADDKLRLAKEYIELVLQYPTGIKIRSVVFHVRRMLKETLNKYQLMEDCIACKDIQNVIRILQTIEKYQQNPELFDYDTTKAKKEKEMLLRRKYEEGKRKAFEERMIRKAKRQKKDDIMHYLKIGSDTPTLETIRELKAIPSSFAALRGNNNNKKNNKVGLQHQQEQEQQALIRSKQLEIWNSRNHSQHCLSYHLGGDNDDNSGGDGGCSRGRSCAFLHVDAVDGSNSGIQNSNTQQIFQEKEELAG